MAKSVVVCYYHKEVVQQMEEEEADRGDNSHLGVGHLSVRQFPALDPEEA